MNTITLSARLLTMEQVGADEITRYWFSVEETSDDTDYYIERKFAVSDHNGEESILDADGCPLTPGDAITEQLRALLVVTDEMRQASR